MKVAEMTWREHWIGAPMGVVLLIATQSRLMACICEDISIKTEAELRDHAS